MPGKEQIDFSQGIMELENNSGEFIIEQIKGYVEHCGPIFPSYENSLKLLEVAKASGLVDRMVRVEKEGKYSLLSHSIMVMNLSVNLARQLNNISSNTIKTYIVDEPLLAVSSFFHDAGKHLDQEDIFKLGLNDVNLDGYTESYPRKSPWKNIGNNHILKIIALLKSWGFQDHAQTTAHSIYHLTRSKNITIEQAILMLADMSVIDKKDPEPNSWLKSAYIPSLIEKTDQILSTYDNLSEYLKFHDILQVLKSYMEEAGVVFPYETGIFTEQPNENALIDLIKYMHFRHIKRRSIPILGLQSS